MHEVTVIATYLAMINVDYSFIVDLIKKMRNLSRNTFFKK